LKTSPEKLSAALARQLPPVWLISGDEPLTQGEVGDAVRAAARAQGYTEREVFFVERADTGPWDDIFASCQALSLFAERRLIEVRIPSGKPGLNGSKALQELASVAGQDLMLMVTTGALDWQAQKAAWVTALDGAGMWVDCNGVSLERFPAWLRQRAQTEGIVLDDDAVQALVLQTEGNLLAAVQELRKLALAGHKQAGVAEVMASVSQSSRFDVTQLGEAVLRGDQLRALRILAGLKAEGVEATLVLWALWQELRAVWVTLVAGPDVRAIWSRNKTHVPTAAARWKLLGRPFIARMECHMSRVDQIIKRGHRGNAWDELALIASELATGKAAIRT
jgi:DNA polymerase III subunit delta